MPLEIPAGHYFQGDKDVHQSSGKVVSMIAPAQQPAPITGGRP
jgi:hypothetical protein